MRLRSRFIVSALGLLALLSTSSIIAQTKVLRLDFVIIQRGENSSAVVSRDVGSSVELISPDGWVRTETFNPATSKTSIRISNDRLDVDIELDPQTKTATRYKGIEQRIQQGLPILGSKAPIKGNKQDLGPASIQGFSCERYLNTLPIPNGPSMESWVCRDPVSGEQFFGRLQSERANGKSVWEEDLKSVTRDYLVDQSAFQIPQGYSVLDK